MSQAQLATPPACQRKQSARASHQQSTNQIAMAASSSNSLEMDTVAVPDPSLKKGYRKEIFDKDDERHRFSCGFCGLILREPLQAECGHRFCQDCQKAVEEAVNHGGHVKCRNCTEEGMADAENKVDPKEMFPDRGFKKEMMKIRTKCPNEMCVWTGPFTDYISHEAECQHQPLVCEQCHLLVPKQKIEQHKTRECSQRVITCDHCNTDIVFEQKKVHLKDCPKVPESCGQCSKNIPRDQLKKHQNQDCPNRTVTCPIDGCGQPQPQSRFSQHVQKDQPKHLAWVLSRISDLEQSLSAHSTSQIFAGASTQQGPSTPTSLDADLRSMKQKLDWLEQQIQDSIGHGGATGGGGSRSDTSGQVSSAVGASAAILSSSSDRVEAMELKVNTLEPILSVLHGEMNRCISAIEALEKQLSRERHLAEEWRQKVESYEATIKSMSDTLAQRDTKLRQLENLGQDRPDGTLLWRITNFSQVRKDAVAGSVTNIHSRPFYSGPMGYKMCVRLYPNGDGMGKGSHLSLFFSIMRGPHDALLPWPFKQKVYFMLVDQTFKKHIVDAFRSEPTSSSFQRPTSEMNIATGCPMFVQLNKLSQPGFIKDDTMYIRVLVETDGLEDHLKQFDPRTMPLQQ